MPPEGQRRGSLPPAPPPPGTAAADIGERRASLGTAALANLKGLGARVAAGVMGSNGRRPSRMSFAAPGGGHAQAGGASRRGSLAPGAVLAAAEAAIEAQDPSGSTTALHPGLDRIKSFK